MLCTLNGKFLLIKRERERDAEYEISHSSLPHARRPFPPNKDMKIGRILIPVRSVIIRVFLSSIRNGGEGGGVLHLAGIR